MHDNTGRPDLSLEEAENLARTAFGLDTTASYLPSYADQNFKLKTTDGAKFVLKVFNSVENDENLDLQARAMGALAENGLPVAAVLERTVVTRETGEHQVRLVSWLEGIPLALVRPVSTPLLRDLGSMLARTDLILKDVDGTGGLGDFQWDLAHVREAIDSSIGAVPEEKQALVRYFRDLYVDTVAPNWESLPSQLVHNDANDYNVLVSSDKGEERTLSGLLDFGDLVVSARIGNVAIAAAYVGYHREDPLDAVCAVLSAYHEVNPVSEAEVEVVFSLVASRLIVSVCMSAYQQIKEPENEYLAVSAQAGWDSLAALRTIHPRLAHYRLRAALGWEPVPGSIEVAEWISNNTDTFAQVVLGPDPDALPVVFDFSVASLEFDPEALCVPGVAAKEIWRRTGDAVSYGRWNEPRLAYTGDAYATLSGERRTIHIGVDLFRPAGAPVHAPLDGVVHSWCVHDAQYDYGGCVILEHTPHGCQPFWTLYGHLSHESVGKLSEGQKIANGEAFVRLGPFEENGGWVPHLHFQIVTDLLDLKGTFPGVAEPASLSSWHSLSPSPGELLGLGSLVDTPDRPSVESLLERREEHIGSALSVSYENKLHIVRGYMQYLYDAEGRAFLDAVNNVPHVGHSNPRVVAALHSQMRTLTTNTRYLHGNILRYAQRLTATLPASLDVCYFVNSGSEANDLALRLARAYTGKTDTIVLEGAYHGNLTSLIDISPYKFGGAGGQGKPATTHVVPMPDCYRGEFKGMTLQSGEAYAAFVREAAKDANSAAFIAESVPGCGGQIVPPPGYLCRAAQHIRDAGGVFIADEVQVGMGRAGSAFWGFELSQSESESVVPDIVVVGKPIGNGHPLAAVITTREIADAFDNGMEYFNTFGGNPASCAVGLAVLDEIEDQNLQENARIVGAKLLQGLIELKSRHSIIGDVRGVGLFLGVELVRNHATLQPAAAEATYISNRMRDDGILISTDGPLHNVLKIKPPMVFTAHNAEVLLRTLDKILSEDFVQARLSLVSK